MGMPYGYPLLVYLVRFNHGSSSGPLKTKKARPTTGEEKKPNSILEAQDKDSKSVVY